MSNRFEAFKNGLANAEREFTDRNRLVGANAQETLDGARKDFTHRMAYVGKLAVRLDQRYKDTMAAGKAEDANEPVADGRELGFEGWPAEGDAPSAGNTVAQFSPSSFTPAPPATPVSRAMPPAPTAGFQGPGRQEGYLHDADLDVNGWSRG